MSAATPDAIVDLLKWTAERRDQAYSELTKRIAAEKNSQDEISQAEKKLKDTQNERAQAEAKVGAREKLPTRPPENESRPCFRMRAPPARRSTRPGSPPRMRPQTGKPPRLSTNHESILIKTY